MEICSLREMLAFRDDCKCSSVMVARAAQYNPSVFSKNGLLPLEQVIKDYLKIVRSLKLQIAQYNVIEKQICTLL